MNDVNKRPIIASFRQFRAWAQGRSLPADVTAQVDRCVLHSRCLEMNLRSPSAVLIAGAAADFAKLEAMLHTT